MNSRINLNKGYLQLVTYSDSQFIHILFSDKDVRTYYALRADHAANLDAFVSYLVNSIAQKTGMDYIIYNEYGQKVGLITAELNRMQNTGEIVWNIGYAIAPRYRNYGYATSALDGLTTYLLNNYSIKRASLDICIDNKGSERVAQKCGYKMPEEPGSRIGYIDPDHMDLGMRIKWFKSIGGKRLDYFNKAVIAYRAKDYGSAILFYRRALNEHYIPGTPFTDAQIYSNIGMAYSASGQYQEAFRCLKRAQALGLTNPSIENELQWLRINAGLY